MNQSSDKPCNRMFNLEASLVILFFSLVVILLINLINKSYYNKDLGILFIRTPLITNELNLKDLVCITGKEVVMVEEGKVKFEPILEENFTDEKLSLVSEFLEFRERVLEGINATDWSWENDFAYAYVYNLDSAKDLAYLNFSIPDDKRFQSGDNDVSVVKVSCVLESTATVNNMNLELTEIGVDFFGSIEPTKDAIFFQCLNDKCDEIGWECIIVKGAYIE